MLLPDNIQPELTVYYNGAFVIEELKKENSKSIIDLFYRVVEKQNMSFQTFVLCLDWLYLIDVAKVNEDGGVELCILNN